MEPIDALAACVRAWVGPRTFSVKHREADVRDRLVAWLRDKGFDAVRERTLKNGAGRVDIWIEGGTYFCRDPLGRILEVEIHRGLILELKTRRTSGIKLLEQIFPYAEDAEVSGVLVVTWNTPFSVAEYLEEPLVAGKPLRSLDLASLLFR